MSEKRPSSSHQHKSLAAEQGPVKLAIVTVSDSRTPETDTNAHYLRAQIEALGHEVFAYRLIKDEPDQVLAALEDFAGGEAQIILYNGGTGISRRDTTYDALSRKLEKTLPGFGELFRMLSYEQVGSAAMFSRATAGVYRGKVVISTPGSPAAVQLAWEKLIAPELQHLAWEVGR
jgi:molybdenum cofactor biosynthesis protein B